MDPTVAESAEIRGSRWDRLRRYRDWYVPGLVAAFTLFCLGPSLVGARALISVNLLTRFYPWVAYGAADQGHEACTGDTVDVLMPGVAYIRSQLFHGRLGSWQDLVVGGAPMGSVPNVGLFDPLSLPYLVMPLWLAPAFVKLLEIIVSVGGTYLFLRRLNVGRPAATLAGFIYVTSGFMVMWTNWPQTRVAALIPALFWMVERLIQRRGAGDVALVGLVIAAMLLGGFPAITGWALYFVGIYAIVRIVALYRNQLRTAAITVGMALGGLVLGGILSLVQMLPFASLYQNTDLSYRADRGTIGLPFTALLTLIVPDANGLCIVGGTPQRGGINPIELVGYIGAAALVLAVTGIAVGFARRHGTACGGGNVRGVWSYLVSGTVFLVVLVYCSPWLRSVFVHLPVFSNNPVARLRVMLGFLLAVLAGVGFDALLRSRDASRGDKRAKVWRTTSAALTWVVVGVVGVILLWKVRRAAIAGGYLDSLYRLLVAPTLLTVAALVLVAAVAAGVVILATSGRVSARSLAFVALPLLVVVQGTSFFHTVVPGDDPHNFYPQTPAHRFLEANLGHERFSSAGGVLYPATALYYGLRTPTGHSFTASEWKDLLKQVDPKVMQIETFSAFTGTVNGQTIGDSPVLDRLAVKYFALSPDQVTGRFQALPVGNGSVSIANGSSMTCTLPAQALRGVTVESLAPLHAANPRRGVTITVTAREGDRTVSSDRFLGQIGQGAGPISVALAGEDLGAGGPITIAVGVSGGQEAMTLAANDGVPICAAVNPQPDNLRLVHADAGTVIYQRLTALPRIRWASKSTVIPDPAQRLAALKAGVPADTVVLGSPGAAISGQPGTVSMRTDRGGDIAADVNARGAGYLVVADAMQQPGWSVTVDGKSAKLVPADHAMVAVAVPRGLHHIAFRYHAPGLRTGAVATGVGILIVIGLFWWEMGHRRRRTRPAMVEPPPTAEMTAVGAGDLYEHEPQLGPPR
jgi:hypothetical protein